SEEILIETASTHNVEVFFTDGQSAHSGQGESNAIGQFFALEKSRGAAPIFRGREPVILITNASGILRGGDERAVAIHKFDEIEAVVLSGAVGIVNIERRIGVGAAEVQSHAEGDVGVGNVFDLLDDDFTALGKFLFELGDKRFGTLAIHRFEGVLRVVGDAV